MLLFHICNSSVVQRENKVMKSEEGLHHCGSELGSVKMRALLDAFHSLVWNAIANSICF